MLVVGIPARPAPVDIPVVLARAFVAQADMRRDRARTELALDTLEHRHYQVDLVVPSGRTVDRAGTADKVVARDMLDMAASLHRERLPGRVDKDRMVFGRSLAALALYLVLSLVAVSRAAVESPGRAVAWPTTPHPRVRWGAHCPADQIGGSIARHRRDTVYHQGARQSHSAGRMFHPRR